MILDQAFGLIFILPAGIVVAVAALTVIELLVGELQRIFNGDDSGQ